MVFRMNWFRRWRATKKEKNELKTLIQNENSKATDIFISWDSMIVKKNKTKVLEAGSDEELSMKWEAFYEPINDGRGRLNSLFSIDDKKFAVEQGRYYLFIEYIQFCLKEGSDHEEYEKHIKEYDRLSSYIIELEQKLSQI